MSRVERVLHPERSALDGFGYELRRLRKARGYSIARLATLLYVSADLIQKIETARRRPSREIAERLDVALGTEDVFLGLWEKFNEESMPAASSRFPAAAELAEADDMNRREMLAIMSMAGAVLAIGAGGDQIDWERVGAAENAGFDGQSLDEFAALNTHLWRAFVLARTKSAVLPMARDQLDVVVGGLGRAGSADIYRRLCALASSLLQLSGEIMFDGNQYTEAAHCYLLAASAAREANSLDLWACALTRHAFIGVYEKRFDKAAGMLELAGGLARRGDQSLATRHWVAAVKAQAFAGLGDLDSCQQALDAAEEVRGLRGDFHNGGWLRFDGSRIAEERGSCYVELERFDLAESALTAALGENLTARRRGSVLADLAIIGAHKRDIDRMVEFADAAGEMIRQTGSGVIVRRLSGLQSYLTPFLSDTRVRNLSARIESLAVGIATP